MDDTGFGRRPHGWALRWVMTYDAQMRVAQVVVIVLGAIVGTEAQAQPIGVVPSCFRTDSDGQLYVHVQVGYKFEDKDKHPQTGAYLFHAQCRRRLGAQTYECSAVKVDLGKPSLSFLSIGSLDVTMARHRGPTTILQWGLHTITIRWDRGTVETDYDAESTVPTTFLPATCGKPNLVNRTVGKMGPTWSWGSQQ